MKNKWFVVYTKSRCEKKVAELFTQREIVNYCPLNRVEKQWADRKKLVYEPLFASYVFVWAAEEELYIIKNVSSYVVNFVYWLGKPAVIKDSEIQSIQHFLTEYTNVTLEKQRVHIGQMVRIVNGPLINLEGNVTAIVNGKAKLSLGSLGYVMIAEVRLSNIALVNSLLN